MSTGDWNASHYKNTEFDALGDARTSAAAERRGAAQGDEADGRASCSATRRSITDYFISYVTASSSKVKNYVPEGLSHIRLAKVSLA